MWYIVDSDTIYQGKNEKGEYIWGYHHSKAMRFETDDDAQDYIEQENFAWVGVIFIEDYEDDELADWSIYA